MMAAQEGRKTNLILLTTSGASPQKTQITGSMLLHYPNTHKFEGKLFLLKKFYAIKKSKQM